MAQAPAKRSAFPPGRWSSLVLAAAGLLAALLLTAYLLLPLAAERLILPRLLGAAGIQDYAVAVRQLGLFGLQAGPLRIGPEAAPGIAVASLSARYSPLGLWQGRLDRITLAGVRLLVREKAEGGIAIPGLPLPDASPERRPQAPLTAPVTVGGIEVTQGALIIQRKDQQLPLSFEAVVASEADPAVFVAALRFTIENQRLALNARIDPAANRIAADWEAANIRIGSLLHMAGLAPPPLLTGSGGFRGRLQGRLSPFAINDLDTTLRHGACRLYWDAGRLDLSGETNREDIVVRIGSTDIAQWRVETSPVRVRLHEGGQGRLNLAGTLRKTDEGHFEWQGRLDASLTADPVQKDLPGLTVPLALATTARFETGGRWRGSIQQASGDASRQTPAAVPEPSVIRLEPTLFDMSFQGAGRSFSGDFNWRFRDLAWAGAGLQAAIGAVEGTGRYRFQDAAGEGHLALSMAPIAVNNGRFTSDVKRLSVQAEATIEAQSPLRLEGLMALSGGRARLTDDSIAAGGFNARLPLVWPPPAKGPPGRFSVAALQWEGRALGALTGRLRQAGRGIDFSVRHDNRLVPGFKLTAEGVAGLAAGSGRPVARVRWSGERSSDEGPLMVSALMPNPPGFPITLGGRLFAHGEMAFQNGLTGSLTAGMEAGRLQVDEKGLVIEGLETALQIPDIRRLRSAPAQMLTFEAVSFGALRARDGQLGFQLEPGGVLFLEGGRFRWCGGSVIAPATRFHPGEDRYALTVFCDRLKLDMLLEQLGLARAEGGGAISGLIPVALENGLITFDNAFLYSTPGEGGVIRVQGSEVLTAGIPPGTPQYNQMELARYALKDYDYDWAKITMNSEADNLLVQLQFDGKPAEPLPFVYDSEAGGFVKTDPGQPGSVFQGIRLDVNVTLPLNRMLRYRELFKRLQ